MILKLLFLLIFVGSSWFIAHRLAPLAFVTIGRMFGFKMKLTPLGLRRVQRFQRIRRGHICFVLMTTALVMSGFLELFLNNKALYVQYAGHWQSPAVASWVDTWVPFLSPVTEARKKDFGLEGEGELDYRTFAEWVDDPTALGRDATRLEASCETDEIDFRARLTQAAVDTGGTYDVTSPLPDWKLEDYEGRRQEAAKLRELQKGFEAGKASIVMPLYPYSAQERLLDLAGSPPHKPFQGAPMPPFGTDSQGKDVLAQLAYGFRVGLSFALMVTCIGYFVGVLVGGAMGYFGGWFDILVQRVIEIWSSIPFLFTIMIIASVMQPGFWLLALLLVVLRSWIGITYTVRGEFYREKSRDYVQAGRAIGVRDFKLMTRHILPNSLVPVVTFMPFEIVAYILTLVSLDYLGFGLPPGTPSWGALLRDGSENVLHYPHLVAFPVVVFAGTLFTVVMIGEAVREAFDPKEYSRLR